MDNCSGTNTLTKGWLKQGISFQYFINILGSLFFNPLCYRDKFSLLQDHASEIITFVTQLDGEDLFFKSPTLFVLLVLRRRLYDH